MDRLFLVTLNMSISASFCILAVILVRLLLMRAPKIFSYLLWAVVIIRLICPVLPETDFGLIPNVRLVRQQENLLLQRTEHIYESYVMKHSEQSITDEKIYDNYDTGIDSNAESGGDYITERVEEDVIYYLPSEQISQTSYPLPVLDKRLTVITWIWLLGALGLIFYASVKYGIFLHAIKKKEVTTPFVAGFLHPTVYLPKGLEEMQKQMVLEHENVHIKRLDYLVKPIVFLVCCVHWFNPLVWVFFFLMERDMETSCDEAVMQKIGYDRRKDYADTLLGLSQSKAGSAGYPIAFGENHVKSRIKGVVKMKKAGIGVSIAAAVVLFVAAALLLVNRTTGRTSGEEALASAGDERIYLPTETITENDSTDPEKEHLYLPAENAAESDSASQDEMRLPDDAGTEIMETSGEGVEPFSLPDIKEYIFLPNEDFLEDDVINYLPSPSLETGNQETIMNYAPTRERDQFEVLNLPQIDESFQDTEIDILILPQINESFQDIEILFAYPVEGARISDEFGSRIHPVSGAVLFHLGMDFAAEAGTPITAAADGTVVKTGYDFKCGNYLILLHENGAATYYFHCRDILAEEGKKVKTGEQIATVGSTGESTGAHLHFGVSRNGEYVEPEFAGEEMQK